jgi:hypothetical protein
MQQRQQLQIRRLRPEYQQIHPNIDIAMLMHHPIRRLSIHSQRVYVAHCDRPIQQNVPDIVFRRLYL